MPNFDGTIDNRWRPDFESSQRRVREEETGSVIPSRELALIPPSHKKTFEAHDRQTAALIRRMAALERLPHGGEVTRLLGEWDWLEKMMGYEEKQRFLEPLIIAAQRQPEENEHLLIFLMLVFEPVRRSVSKAFVDTCSGLDGGLKDVNWGNRAEARMIKHVERQELYDVTREAALEACSSSRPQPLKGSSPGCGRRSPTAPSTSCVATCRKSQRSSTGLPRQRRSSRRSRASSGSRGR